MSSRIPQIAAGAFFIFSLFVRALAQTPPTGMVNPLSCKDCHEDEVRSFFESAHGIKADPRSPAAQKACDACHGSSATHLASDEGSDLTGIFYFSKDVPPAKMNAVCLQCHNRGKTALWAGSVHESHNLACISCHTIHGTNRHLLAAADQTALCTKCHPDVRADIQKFSHHPIMEGRLNCTDCHNPHGTVTEKLIDADSVNQKCFQCHAEKRGPYLWEHPPVVENCLNCHTPHGSSHDDLLVLKPPFLCQRCHSSSRHPGTLYALSASGKTVYTSLGVEGFYRACLNCHARIHGSNDPSGIYFLR